jgi:EpsI family protein
MLDRGTILVPAFVVLQAAFVYWATSGERLPPKPDFSALPGLMGDWEKFREDPIEPAVVDQLGADKLLNSSYVNRGTLVMANLFVAWFQSQRGGASQPHSPQVCLPGAGWTFDRISVMTLDTGTGAIPVNLDIITQGRQRAVVLYWFQTPRRAIASEWSAKFWTVADAVRDRRTDTSIVRIVVWNGDRSDQATIGSAVGFARKAYPALRQMLPR